MRPIKFLLWDTKQECFVNEPYHAISLLGTIQIEGHTSVEPKRYIPLQFTGLVDKKGKDIYEGFICTYTRGRKCVVFYDRGAFWFVTTGNLPKHFFKTYNAHKWEIIGNIYETPDLIKTGT